MLKKIAAYTLIVLVVFFTVISLLAIWDVIEVENVINKSLGSLLIIFVAAAVIVFIFAVLLKVDNNSENNKPR